jgi:guanine nucleotide-binding protein G(i) subunit alpha
MKIIHQNGYSVDELAMYRLTIYKNLVDCAKALVQALRQFNIEPEGSANKVCVDSRQGIATIAENRYRTTRISF